MQPGEIVHRPDPGLARGIWEAPWWSFAALATVAIVLALLYVLVRMRILRITRARVKDDATTKTTERNGAKT